MIEMSETKLRYFTAFLFNIMDCEEIEHTIPQVSDNQLLEEGRSGDYPISTSFLRANIESSHI